MPHRTITPTVYRGATLSVLEVEVLKTIKDVIRKGYIRRIDPDKIVLDQASIDGALGDVYVDCTAKAFSRRPSVPIFDRDRITLQPVRAWRMSFSAAVIAHVEAVYDDSTIRA